MKVKNWNLIEESKGGTMLEPGGYVCRITAVQDVPEREYLWIMYDVIEGEHAGIYSGLGVGDDWKHRFTRSYKDSAAGMFKAFINRVQESNRGFVWDMEHEQQFVGKEIGLVFGKELYTNDKGEDKERTVVSYVVASQDIRSGNYKVPEPKDRRENITASAPAPASGGYYDSYSDVPFNVPSNTPSWA